MIKLVTLNMCLLPVGFRHNLLINYDKDNRLNEFLNLFSSIPIIPESKKNDMVFKAETNFETTDIVCLQEVFSSQWSNKWKDIIAAELQIKQSKLNIATSPSPKLSHFHLFDSGLMILTRFPIVKCHFCSFDVNPLLVRISDRGFLHIEVSVETETSRSSLHIINCHLHPSEGSCTTKSAEKTRKAQIQQMKQYIDSEINSSEPVIVVGDFNVHQGNQESESMRKVLQMHVESKIEKNIPTFHNMLPFCGHQELLCADFAIARGVNFDSTQVLTSMSHISDHYPVTTSFTLNPNS
jgi:endonuclease/exonuclease/phosphatase family metal-dependent hydrolase